MSEDEKVDVQLERVVEMKCTSCRCQMDVSELEPFTAVECPKCNSADRVPARFGEFMLLDLINTGGMGGVYRARDESLGRLVAIKVMLTSMGEDEAFVERFKMEAQAAAKLNHPKVAQIYSYGQVHSQPYIVMELVPGKGFDGMIDQNASGMDPSDVFRIGLDIAEGLAAADEIGLIHGDIKPENILLDEKGNAKLVDFGLAGYADQAASEGIWGTPYYIAPEKVQRKNSDARSDIFSLGATLYHALAGTPPFEGETPLDVVMARLDQDAVPLSEVKESISRKINDTIARMLQREPSQRHPTYKSVIADMRQILESQPETTALRIKAGGGKKVVLKKKKTTIRKADATQERGVSVSNGGRIVIPKRSAPSPLKQAVAQVAQPPEEVIAARQAKKRKTRLIVLLVLLSVLLTVGGIVLAVYMKGKEAREIEGRRIQFELSQAIDEVKVLHTTIGEEAAKGKALAGKFDVFVKRVQRAVKATLGETLELAALPLPEEEEEDLESDPAEKEDDAPGDDAGAVDPPEPTPEPVSKSVAFSDDDGREAPAGMPSRAASDRMRRQRNPDQTDGPREEEDVAPMEAPAEKPEMDDADLLDEAPVPEPMIEGPEIKVLGMRALMLERAAKQDIPKIDKATRLADLILTTSTNAASAEPVLARVPDLSKQREALRLLVETFAKRLEEAGELTLKVERLAAEDRENRKEERQAEEDRRKVQERKEKIDAELSRAEAISARASDLLLRTNYEKALREAEWGLKEMSTEEGKAAAALIVDRCQRLLGLRDYLVKKLNAEPFRWGWVRSRTQKEDVLGADKGKVILKSREVPWIEVSKPQFIRFVEHYLTKPGTRRSERGEQYLATAAYCYEHGGKEAAAAFKAKALESAPFLEKQANLLVPDE